jgi:hypothetical protein
MDGGRRAGVASGDEKEGAWRAASRHASQYGQSCFHMESASRDGKTVMLMDECVRIRTYILGINHPFTLSPWEPGIVRNWST